MSPTAIDILQSVYGHDSFRGNQQAAIDALLAGQDVFLLMPTGGGKSICYQIPALLRSGTAIIISPLIALMEDQVQTLNELGVAAAYLNSSLSSDAANDIRNQFASGDLQMLYVAPERLLATGFMEFLDCGPDIALFAIDEAHCVSQWGHDFRPEYMQLDLLKRRFPGVPRIALTATADPPTQTEIVERLELQNPAIFISSFDRANIQYRVELKNSPKKQLLHLLQTEHVGDSGIVYCQSRRKVESLAEWLTAQGIEALPYHAGLPVKERRRNQNRFQYEDAVVMVATIAFGMGVDKPNVRFVAHLDLPRSVEAYYQETGRAGRDDLPATAWMAYSLGDLVMTRQFIESSQAPDDRKRIEHQKLTALLGFGETTSCRRQVLLRYFGEEHPGNCGNCDNCLSPVETWDATQAAQMALSAVYRTGQRFGSAHLTDVLIGNETDRVRQFGHGNLSVFGVGTDHARNVWQSVFRQLVAAGKLRVDISGYGGLSLLPASKAILNGQETCSFRVDPRPKKNTGKQSKSRSQANTQLDDVGRSIFENLRSERAAIARKNNVPPYVILHDATLVEIATIRPTSKSTLQTIKGIGNAKLERYGEMILSAVKECTAIESSAS